ncbi:hypothetical protein GGX14DRAFT_400686 [Mycena pura]|uniref:Uncharacterized protein n=1 Tax=Mycena pura TaxID=153505 RepID=A0AAD6Y958_9AGAR|nr:hypothetical protein GGX14DRAFT_400686 [Mycena pura]
MPKLYVPKKFYGGSYDNSCHFPPNPSREFDGGSLEGSSALCEKGLHNPEIPQPDAERHALGISYTSAPVSMPVIRSHRYPGWVPAGRSLGGHIGCAMTTVWHQFGWQFVGKNRPFCSESLGALAGPELKPGKTGVIGQDPAPTRRHPGASFHSMYGPSDAFGLHGYLSLRQLLAKTEPEMVDYARMVNIDSMLPRQQGDHRFRHNFDIVDSDELSGLVREMNSWPVCSEPDNGTAQQQ